MKYVFFDTVGLIALINEADQWHSDATESNKLLLRSDAEFLTTSFVLLEAGNALARSRLRRVVTQLETDFREEDRLVFPIDADWHNAWLAYKQSHAGGPSIVDCVSFEVMRRLDIRQAFTNDAHFSDAGFETLF